MGTGPTTQKQVLVVDDDADLLRLVTRLLNRHGCVVTGVQRAKDAALLLQRDGCPHLLILDLMLPDIDGQTFLRQLRAQPDYDALPVLILSASADPNEARTAFRAGADGYLPKATMFNFLPTLVQQLTAEARAVQRQADDPAGPSSHTTNEAT